MRVAVTGASGFVGGAVCRLLREHGWQVEAFGRRGVDPAQVAGSRYRSWDLTTGPLPDPPSVDAVVHAAAHVSDRAGVAGPAWDVNVLGTGHVVATWPTARLVHVSSASVYHPHHAQQLATEDEVPDPDHVRWPSGYGPTKLHAERLVLQRHPDAVVLRPHAVYGPGDTTLLPRVLAAVRGQVLPLPGDGRQRHSLTRIEQLAEACRLACLAPTTAAGAAYNITDEHPVVLAEVLAEALAARGRPVRVVPVGRRAALAVVTLTQWRSRLGDVSPSAPSGRATTLSRYAVEHLALERTFDVSRAKALLGYRPRPTDLSDAVRW